MKTMLLEEFIHRSQILHGNKFDYSEVIWVNARVPINIICPHHGKITTLPIYHYNLNRHGCYLCGNEQRNQTLKNNNRKRNLKTNEYFITKARKIHGNRYDYTKVNYQGNKLPVIIICNKHGEFKQRPDKHAGKTQSNCPKCALNSRKVKLKGVYTFDYFVNNPAEQNVPGKIYLIEMFSSNEKFYKIGITKTEVSVRFKSGYKKYNVNIITHADCTLFNAYENEQKLLTLFKNNQYKPKERFGGWNECFTLNHKEIKQIIQVINDLKKR